MHNVRNLNDICALHQEAIQAQFSGKKARDILSQTETAINRFTLPGWGHKPPKGRKPTKAEKEAAFAFRETVTVEQFANALEAQEKGFELLGASSGSRYTYSSRLKELLSWCEKQPWWGDASASTQNDNRCTQSRKKGYGGIRNTPLVDRPRLKNYGLAEAEITPRLQAELDEFFRFRTQKNYPHRLVEPVKKKTCHREIKILKLILGWFHHRKEIPLEDLTLSLLIPKLETTLIIDSETAKVRANEIADYIDQWACELCEFLEKERNTKSPHTRHRYLSTALVFFKFQYFRERQDLQRLDVLVIEKGLRRRIAIIGKEFQSHQSVANQELKWLELPQVLEEIVEPLRGECNPLHVAGTHRSIRAIAGSHQRYLMWGFLTYMPPRRQQEIRELKVALSCPINRPPGIPPDGLFQPLPQGRNRDREYGYLYRTAEGIWVMDITPEAYKTGNSYGHQTLEIPNVPFPNGKCFYDYLETWLYGYYEASDGSIQSCGVNFNPIEQTIERWYPGRMAFKPEHDFVFTQLNSKPFTDGNVSNQFSTTAHAFTGKRLTPHLLRDIYATYFLDQGYSDAMIASLAYAMGHSPKMLRKVYDRRRPSDKRRPIQKAVSEVVQRSLGMMGQISQEALSAKEQILALIPQLTLEERHQIKLAL